MFLLIKGKKNKTYLLHVKKGEILFGAAGAAGRCAQPSDTAPPQLWG